jgi:hypothetical protein
MRLPQIQNFIFSTRGGHLGKMARTHTPAVLRHDGSRKKYFLRNEHKTF